MANRLLVSALLGPGPAQHVLDFDLARISTIGPLQHLDQVVELALLNERVDLRGQFLGKHRANTLLSPGFEMLWGDSPTNRWQPSRPVPASPLPGRQPPHARG